MEEHVEDHVVSRIRSLDSVSQKPCDAFRNAYLLDFTISELVLNELVREALANRDIHDDFSVELASQIGKVHFLLGILLQLADFADRHAFDDLGHADQLRLEERSAESFSLLRQIWLISHALEND